MAQSKQSIIVTLFGTNEVKFVHSINTNGTTQKAYYTASYELVEEEKRLPGSLPYSDDSDLYMNVQDLICTMSGPLYEIDSIVEAVMLTVMTRQLVAMHTARKFDY